jgi:sterol desaturase/sphingolipid hydroxylase (fatty acid hydroxylase superfamily)
VAWTLIDLAITFLIFGWLAKVSPCNPGQRAFLSRDLPDNALYWFIGVFVLSELGGLYIHWGARLAFGAGAPAATAAILNGYGPMARLPVWAQASVLIVALDFVQYWLHRLFHTDALWPFHAIHHSAEELDWTTTYRIHPVNFALYSAGAVTLIRLAGFAPAL